MVDESETKFWPLTFLMVTKPADFSTFASYEGGNIFFSQNEKFCRPGHPL